MDPFDILDQLQRDVAGRITADPAFAQIAVLVQEKGLTESDVAEGLAGMQATGGKAGAAIVVMLPDRESQYPDAPGPARLLTITARVIELPLINRGDGGTGLTAAHISSVVEHLFHQVTLGDLTLRHTATWPAPIEGAIAFDVRFSTEHYLPAADRVQTPAITSAGGQVALACGTEGADIRYTLDGSYPRPDAALYSAPIDADPADVRAVAYLDGFQASDLAGAAVDPVDAIDQLQRDVEGRLLADENFGTIAVHVQEKGVTESDVDEALAGITTKAGKAGVAAIVLLPERESQYPDIPGPARLVTIAVRVIELPLINRGAGGTGLTAGRVSSLVEHILHQVSLGPLLLRHAATWPVELDDGTTAFDVRLVTDCDLPEPSKVATPAIALDGRVMTASCPTAGAELRYTIDGSYPGHGSTLYSGPVTIPWSALIRLVAYLDDYQASDLVEATTPAPNVIQLTDRTGRVLTDGSGRILVIPAA